MQVQDYFNDKLKIAAFIGASCSFIGIILNIYKIIWCWPLWLVGNSFWIYWSYNKKEWSQLALWLAYQATNLLGWYQWFIR